MDSAFFDATAAPAAAAAPGLSPVVVWTVVVVVVVTGGGAVVVAGAVVTTVAVCTRVVVTVAVVVAITVVVGRRVVVAVAGVDGTVSGSVVGVVASVLVVRFVSDEIAVDRAPWCEPPPQDATAIARANPATAAVTYLTPRGYGICAASASSSATRAGCEKEGA